MKKYIILFYVFVISFYSYGQDHEFTQKVKDLKAQIAIAKKGKKLRLLKTLLVLIENNEDLGYSAVATTTRDLALELDSLNAAGFLYSEISFHKMHILQQPEETLEVIAHFNSKNIDEQKIDPKHIGNMYMYGADAHYSIQNYEQGIALLEKAQKYFVADQNIVKQGQVYSRLGNHNSGAGNFNDASINLRKAIGLFEKIKDTINIIVSKEAMAILYSQSNFFEESLQERKELLHYYPPDHEEYTSTYINVADDYKGRNDYLNYLEYLKLGEKTLPNSQFKYFYEPLVQIMLIDAYALNDSIAEARNRLSQFETNDDWLPAVGNPLYLDSKISLLMAEKKFTQALKLAKEKEDLVKGKQSFIDQYRIKKTLADIYGALGNTGLQNEYLVDYYTIRDSITGVQNVKSLTYYQTLYETEKKDSKIKEQEGNLELLESEARIRNQWFIIAAILGALVFIVYYLNSRFKQKIAKQKAVEQLRTKISADLHDDVGSLLTGLSMQSEILGKNAPKDIKPKLERVSELSRSAMLKMRDAVWVMDARKDNWQSLVDRINEFASEHLGAKELKYKLNQLNPSREEEIAGGTRQHLYLIVKEAIANILKHSNADTVTIDMSKTKKEISLSILDNGKVKNQGTTGLGVSNMQQRIQELNGQLDIFTEDGYQIMVKIPA